MRNETVSIVDDMSLLLIQVTSISVPLKLDVRYTKPAPSFSALVFNMSIDNLQSAAAKETFILFATAMLDIFTLQASLLSSFLLIFGAIFRNWTNKPHKSHL